MKNSISILTALLLILSTATLLWAVSSGSLLSGGFARTDAPTDGYCIDCHTTGPDAIGGTISLSPNPSGEYMPDTTYTVTVTIPDGGESNFGFNVTAQDAGDNNAGIFAITDGTNTQALSGQREYVSHTSSGILQNSWSFNWTAPSIGTGSITFYLAGVAGDANGSNSGDKTYKTTLALTEAIVSDVEDDRRAALARSFNLEQNYPNPFNPKTTISYSLKVRGNVKLTIYNITGQEVVTLVEGTFSASEYRTTWDSKDKYGNQVASGLYFYSLRVDDFVKTKKMVLLQ